MMNSLIFLWAMVGFYCFTLIPLPKTRNRCALKVLVCGPGVWLGFLILLVFIGIENLFYTISKGKKNG